MIADILEKMKVMFWQEIAEQRQNAILLVPVFVAIGVAGYFALPYEPSWRGGGLCLLIAFSSLFLVDGSLRVILIALFLMCSGFTAAQIRTHVVYTPILSKELKFAEVQGRIEVIEVLDKGVRLTLSDIIIDGQDSARTPRKVRLKLWRGEGYRIGQVVDGLASLTPPSPPVIPRGFDFQRHMYFRGIGAVGFFYKSPEIIEQASLQSVFSSVEFLRQSIAERIGRAMDAPQSGLASALMIGERTSIDDVDMEVIRDSGLAHMLAISGLHIGLLSGAVFFVARFLMALFPSFALRYPIKKYAAVIAMGAAFFYMMIAGATIPTQRAMVSVAVIFFAVLLDRSALSLRVVAFAALCVLLLFPESLISASFQMSFAAVTVLVAFYDWTRPLWARWGRQSGWWKKAGLYFVGVAVTSVVAGFATAPLTLFHFQQLPVYGVLANVVCVPILAFWVMPLAIVSFVLMLFGLERLALYPMQYGLDWILSIAHKVAEIPFSVWHVPAFSFLVLVFFVSASLSVIILRGRLRVIFASCFVVLTLINFQYKQYDAFVSSDFDLVAFWFNEPHLLVSDARKSQFMRGNWERMAGLDGQKAEHFPKEGHIEGEEYNLRCDEMACRFEGQGGGKLSYLKLYNHDVFEVECGWADVIISQDIYDGKDCAADHVLNRRDGKYYGVHALRFMRTGVWIERVEDYRGRRPWVERPLLFGGNQ